MEIKRARLEGRLEDVGDVGVEDVVEEVGEQGSDDASFGVVALPATVSVPA